MRLHGRNSALFGKVRRFLDVRDPRRTRLARNKANRERPLIKVPNFLPWPSDDQRGRLNLALLQGLTQPADKIHLKFIRKHLAGRQAELAHLGHRSIGIPPDANNQAKAQRLFPLIGGYIRRALTSTKGLCKWSIESGLAFCSSHFAKRSGQRRRCGSLQENATILSIHTHGHVKFYVIGPKPITAFYCGLR